MKCFMQTNSLMYQPRRAMSTECFSINEITAAAIYTTRGERNNVGLFSQAAVGECYGLPGLIRLYWVKSIVSGATLLPGHSQIYQAAYESVTLS